MQCRRIAVAAVVGNMIGQAPVEIVYAKEMHQETDGSHCWQIWVEQLAP